MANAHSSPIPGQNQYEQNELRRAYQHIAEVGAAPLADRKEAQKAFFVALHDPELLRERIEWLLVGNYGKGQQLMAESVVESPRMNRVAALSQLIACFEWQCDRDRARLAWKACTLKVQSEADAAILAVIKEWEAERDEL